MTNANSDGAVGGKGLFSVSLEHFATGSRADFRFSPLNAFLLVGIVVIGLGIHLEVHSFSIEAVGLGALILTGWKQTQGKMSWVFNWDAWAVVQWSDFGIFELNRHPLLLNRLLVLSLTVFLVALAVRVFALDQGLAPHEDAAASVFELGAITDELSGRSFVDHYLSRNGNGCGGIEIAPA